VENKPTMIADRPRLTAEAFFEIAQLPENQDRRLELQDGEIIEMASSRKKNTITAMRIGHFISAIVIPADLGYVTGADGGYKLAPRTVRQPDVGYISKVRAGGLDGIEFDTAPDLAVEIVSPDEDVLKKAREYFKAGARIVWAVYTDEQVVLVLTPTADGDYSLRELGIDDTLDGGDVLLGFSVAVNAIFPTE
jgi:Uma2 family endonuclease